MCEVPYATQELGERRALYAMNTQQCFESKIFRRKQASLGSDSEIEPSI